MELTRVANAFLILGEGFSDDPRYRVTFIVPLSGHERRFEVSSDLYGGTPRRHWSRLETRAKEHSVKASRKVLLNLVASESEW